MAYVSSYAGSAGNRFRNASSFRLITPCRSASIENVNFLLIYPEGSFIKQYNLSTECFWSSILFCSSIGYEQSTVGSIIDFGIHKSSLQDQGLFTKW